MNKQMTAAEVVARLEVGFCNNLDHSAAQHETEKTLGGDIEITGILQPLVQCRPGLAESDRFSLAVHYGCP